MSTHRYHEKAEGGLGQVLPGSLISSSGLLTMVSQVSWCRRSNSPSMGHRMTFASLHYRGMIQKLTGCLDKSDAQLMLQELQPASLSSVPANGYFVFSVWRCIFWLKRSKGKYFYKVIETLKLITMTVVHTINFMQVLKKGFHDYHRECVVGYPCITWCGVYAKPVNKTRILRQMLLHSLIF